MQYDAHECLLLLLPKIYPNINYDCMFKINKQHFCKDCGHTANIDGVYIDWFLHLEDSRNIETISGLLDQITDSQGKYFKNYRCVDGFQKLNTSIKAVYVT